MQTRTHYKKYKDSLTKNQKAVLETINIEIGDMSDLKIDDMMTEMFDDICKELEFDDTKRPCLTIDTKIDSRPDTLQPKHNKVEVDENDFNNIKTYLETNNHDKLKYELAKNPQVTVGVLFTLLNENMRRNLTTSISPDIADDYIQHAFKRLLETSRSSNGWHGTGPIHAWLARVAKNAFVEHQRSKETSFVDFGQDENSSFGDGKQDSEEIFANNDHYTPLTIVHYSGTVSEVENNISYRMSIDELQKSMVNENYRVLQLLMDGYTIENASQILNMPLSRAKSIHEEIKAKMLKIMD